MSREARWWLAAAGVAALVVAAAVAVFGVRSLPDFPGLDNAAAPEINATVAVVLSDDDVCLHKLDVATGAIAEVLCDDWVWIEGWAADGRLVVQRNGARSQRSAVDLETGELSHLGDRVEESWMPEDQDLRARSRDGRATLTDISGPDDLVLIDVEGPLMYGFWSYGRSGDWVWVIDSEERLLVVSADGASGPWTVARNVQDAAWR